MKKIFYSAISAGILFLACQNQAANNSTTTLSPGMKSGHDKNKFAGVEFASKKDFVCGMPVTAGVSDTAHYKNKIYGFCSSECKAAFEKNPEAYVAGN